MEEEKEIRILKSRLLSRIGMTMERRVRIREMRHGITMMSTTIMEGVDRSKPGSHGSRSTPLSQKMVTTVFTESEHHEIFNIPPSVKTPINRWDNLEYYRYYHDIGHTIEEYRVLKDEVERLVQRGQLKEYARGANQQPRQLVQDVRPPPQDN